jgi:two-component system, NtrC family, sensor kinase
MENHHYYRSLNRNLVLIMVLVSITPLLLIAGLIGYRFETSYREKAMDHLKEVVVKHQQNINMFLDEKLDYIEVLANSYTFEQLSDESFLQKKLAILQQAYGGVFVDLGVVNSEGIQISYAGMFKLEKANYADTDWFRKAIQRNFYISDVFPGLRRLPHFIVTIKQKGEDKSWILRATIDFVTFNSLVEKIRIGETGSAFIINREGEFQTTPHSDIPVNKEFFLRIAEERFPFSSLFPEPGGQAASRGSSPPAQSSMDKEVFAGESEYQGKTFIYVITPLKSGEWILAYQQDAADAFGALRRTRFLAITILVIGGIAIILTAVFLSRRMVSRIERADQDKEMMNEQVIETGKLASVGELAAGIAHEINNPIAIMIEEAGWVEDLLAEEPCMESERSIEVKRALKQIETQGTRCKEITHKLLSFARRTDPRMVEVQINELVEEIISISEQRSKFSNVKLVKKLTPGLPLLMASPSELQQVFLNLINNALDAMGPDGGTIEVASRIADGYIVVDVGDTGQGIPKAIIAKMFDPFFTTKPVGKGTGLGLSICYGIMNKIGGKITVNSAVGVGTTMHVHFPIPPNGERKKKVQA